MFSREIGKLRKSFNSGITKPISWRKKQLSALLAMLKENKDELSNALCKDLRKNPVETELMELIQVQNDIVESLENIDEMTKVKSCKKSTLSMLNKVCIRREPFGVVLIIGAWNYPYLVTLHPLVGAIAAGNCAVLKPSELSPSSADLMQRLITKYLDEDCFSVIQGGVKESSDLINNHRFDLIFYTGGTHVGRIVMQAAARNLTPVILELGGKNPCFIDKSCDLEITARRLVWGKWTNAGQVCVSPDYILCDASMQAPLIEKLKQVIEEYYGEDPRKSSSYGRIINERHLKRLEKLLEGVDVVYGGVIDEKDKYFSPTIVVNVKKDAPIHKEEIFGPILPIFTVKSVEEAIDVMNTGEKSLQMSIFSKDRSVIDRIVAETSSGGVTVNEFFMQNNELDLPFGGVGSSGMGNYHGVYSFEAFSQKRTYYECRTPEFINKIRYPPYTDSKMNLLRVVACKTRPMPGSLRFLLKLSLLASLGLLIAYIFSVIYPTST